MTSSEYRNTVYWTLQAHTPANETDLLNTARHIFNNLGVPFPQGTLADAIRILSSGDYMGWSICNADLAQQCANNGFPAITIYENTLAFILPEEHTVTVNSPVAAVDHPIIWKSDVSSSAQYFVFARLLDNNDVTLKNSDVVSQQNSGIMVAAATTTTCSSSCQVACQSCNTCQTSCELNCQTGCQVSCQTTCQASCQTGCQVSCQSCNSCQSTCESVCQNTCQSSCQTGCQVSCQTNETSTELTPPTNVTVTAISPTTATVSWNNVNGATGYKLYLNTRLVYNVINPICHLTNLSAGTQYTCRVQAYNHSGSTSPITKEFTTKLNTPNMPIASNVNFDFTSNVASVVIAWNAIQGATGYELYMDNTPVYSGEKLYYTIPGPFIGLTCRFCVRAYNDTNTSDKSNYCEFTFDSNNYNAALAKKCAEYALLAYDDICINGANRYYNIESKDRTLDPEILREKLHSDGYSRCVDVNYGDNKCHNVSYVLASKTIQFNGTSRTLVTIIIRGTDSVEWEGNMDITGISYDPLMNEHYSFKHAEEDIRTNSNKSLSRYLSENNIINPIYLITGHSRGAAVANLLAETFSTTAGASNVFAYTFATPNNVKSSVANTSRTNIYNFCFNDDFVPQVPLEGWGYSKHGITIVKSAETMYNNNLYFRNDMDTFAVDSNKGTVSFNPSGTNQLINHVLSNWNNVQAFYQPNHIPDQNNVTSLYTFFRNVIAPAAMNPTENAGVILPYALDIYNRYNSITCFFINGSLPPVLQGYVIFGHHAFTYYTAIKYDLFY